jgi:hypothetical protein
LDRRLGGPQSLSGHGGEELHLLIEVLINSEKTSYQFKTRPRKLTKNTEKYLKTECRHMTQEAWTPEKLEFNLVIRSEDNVSNQNKTAE